MIAPPSPLEIAVGATLGCEQRAEPLVDDWLDPRTALEQAILPALLRPPCLVSFSGGRDSSAVLAVAANLARREGLGLPIPATNVFPKAATTDESDWQAAVVTHLALPDWIRVAHRDELDLIGPYARRVIARHGVLLPCNVHFHAPLLDAAAGGSMLTGVGGDELFAAAQARGSIRHSRVRKLPRHLAAAALTAAPASLRRAVHRRRQTIDMPWLTETARRLVKARMAEAAASRPRSLVERLAWYRSLRYLRVGTEALGLIATDADVRLTHPLLAGQLWAAVGRHARPRGFVNRTHGMQMLFGDLLPATLLGRRTKSTFDEAFWTGTARDFAREWNGTGVPAEYVDPAALSNHWRTATPSAQSFTLLQAAWASFATHRERVKERLDGILV